MCEYADDIQIGGHSKNDGAKKIKIRVSKCVNGITAQKRFYFFALNSEKTELI